MDMMELKYLMENNHLQKNKLGFHIMNSQDFIDIKVMNK